MHYFSLHEYVFHICTYDTYVNTYYLPLIYNYTVSKFLLRLLNRNLHNSEEELIRRVMNRSYCLDWVCEVGLVKYDTWSGHEARQYISATTNASTVFTIPAPLPLLLFHWSYLQLLPTFMEYLKQWWAHCSVAQGPQSFRHWDKKRAILLKLKCMCITTKFWADW
jgi:hypothetical protein